MDLQKDVAERETEHKTQLTMQERYAAMRSALAELDERRSSPLPGA